MRPSLIFLLLGLTWAATDYSFDDVRDKIEELIDSGYGKRGNEKSRKSRSDDRWRSNRGEDKQSEERRFGDNDDGDEESEQRQARQGRSEERGGKRRYSYAREGASGARKTKGRSSRWASDDEEDFFGGLGSYDDIDSSRSKSRRGKSDRSYDPEDEEESYSGKKSSRDTERSTYDDSSDRSSDDSISSVSESKSSASDRSQDVEYLNNHYKNGKKKGMIGKLVEKVATKLKSIPGKVAAGAAVLSGKVAHTIAKASGKVVDTAVGLPGKVVDGVKTIPGKAKNMLPGGSKKKNGDITLNDYTQDSYPQENHFHVHSDRHYHNELHKHQDDSRRIDMYNKWSGYDLERKYGLYPSKYDSYQSEWDVEDW